MVYTMYFSVSYFSHSKQRFTLDPKILSPYPKSFDVYPQSNFLVPDE